MRLAPKLLYLLVALLLTVPAAAQAPAWQLALASRGGTATVSALAAGPGGAVYLAGSFGGTVQFGGVTLTSAADGRTGFVARWNPATNTFAWGWGLGPTTYAGFTALAVRDSLVYAAGAFEGDSLQLPGAGLLSATGQPDAQRADALVLKLADRGSHAALAYAWPASGMSEHYQLAVVPGGVYLAGTFIAPGLHLGGLQLPHSGDQYDGNDFLARLTENPATQPGWLPPLSGHRYGYGEVTPLQLAAHGSSLYVALEVSAGDTLGQGPPLERGAVAVLKFADDLYQPRVAWRVRLTGNRLHAPEVAALAVDGPAICLAGSFKGDTLRVDGQPLVPVGALGSEYVAKLLDAGSVAAPGWWQRVGAPGGDGLLVSALMARAGHLYLAGEAYRPTLQLGQLQVAVGHRRQPELLVAHLSDTNPAATFTWATTAGIRGIWRYERVFITGRYRGSGSYVFWRRQLTPHSLVLAGSQLYVAGDAGGVVRFGRLRLRYPVRGRTAAFLAALPAAP